MGRTTCCPQKCWLLLPSNHGKNNVSLHVVGQDPRHEEPLAPALAGQPAASCWGRMSAAILAGTYWAGKAKLGLL